MENKTEQKTKEKPQNKASYMKTRKYSEKYSRKKGTPQHTEKRKPVQDTLDTNLQHAENGIASRGLTANPPMPEETKNAEISAADSVSLSVTEEKKSAESHKKNKAPRTFEEICADLSDSKAKNVSSIDRYVSLLLDLKAMKELSPNQIQFFFASVSELIEDAWAPFLAKVSTHINPGKMGKERLIASEVISCCNEVLISCGLSMNDLEQACNSFRKSKDEACVTEYLHKAEMITPTETVADGLSPIHKITHQELACVTFIRFNFSFREYAPSSLEPLVKIDRAIAEYFSKLSLREHAGKTLGNALASKVFSTKKITELVYLYAGTTETIQHQAERINILKEEGAVLRARNAALSAEIEKWKGDHADLVARIEALEAEKKRYRQERSDAENMLEYERNKYERQMQVQEAGIAEELSRDIELELQAIRETIEYIDEDNQRRILRRLQRIDDILLEYGGNANA